MKSKRIKIEHKAGYMRDSDIEIIKDENGSSYYECPKCYQKSNHAIMVQQIYRYTEWYIGEFVKPINVDEGSIKFICPTCGAKWSSSSKGLEKLRKRVRT